MNGHLTQKSASWGQWLLNKCGLTDLPICVNCWYCNQTVYLLPGGKQTKHYWYCTLCENTNITNDDGNILDPPLYTALSKQQKEKRKQYSQINNSTNNTTQSILCEECQGNQQIIYDLMNRYNSEDKEMEADDEDLSRAYQYKQYLDNRYPLCDACKHKVTERIKEQYNSLGLKNIEHRGQPDIQTKMVIPKKHLSKKQYKLQGFLWTLTHLLIFHLCLYAIYYPPLSSSSLTSFPVSDTTVVKLGRTQQDYSNNDSNTNNNHSTYIDAITNHISYTYSILLDYFILYLYQENKIQFIINLCNQFIQYVMNQLSITGQFLWTTSMYLLLQLISYGFNINIQTDHEYNHYQQWKLKVVISFYITYFILSSLFMDWHFRASKWIMEKSTIKHWLLYRVVQRWLFIARFWLLWKLYQGSVNDGALFLFGITYFLLLIFSTFYVKVVQSDYWFTKTIGKINSKIQENNSYKASTSSSSSSSSDSYHHQHNIIVQIFGAIFSFFNNVFFWFYKHVIGFMITPFSRSSFKNNNINNSFSEHSIYDRYTHQDREVDGLAADLNRISV